MRPLLRSSAGNGLASPSSPQQSQSQSPQQSVAVSVDSDMVVILASLLCALISVVGLALIARCACRQARARSSNSSIPPARGGLKKKAIEALPTISFVQGGGSLECAICLAELVDGEELRVLPQCNHAFHMACIDTWLGACASCPSCRRAAVMVPEVRSGPVGRRWTLLIIMEGISLGPRML